MTAIVIPSRLDSKRFPRKALHEIDGMPVILHVCRNAELAMSKRSIFVVTPDNEIADLVRRNGFHAIVDPRPAFSGTHKLAQVKDHIPHRNIVILQGDEPLIPPKSISAVVKEKQSINCIGKLVQAYEVIRNTMNRNVAKMVMNQLGYVMYMSRQPIPGGMLDTYKPLGLYALEKNMLIDQQHRGELEQAEGIEPLQFLERGFWMQGIEVEGGQPVDTPEDIEIINAMLHNIRWDESQKRWDVVVNNKVVAHMNNKLEAAYTALYELARP